MLKQTGKEQLKIPANVDHLGELREFVTRIGKKYGYSERVINAFKLSIDEAATNIIKHAYKEWDGEITIRAIKNKNSMSFVLIDNGKYFDPRTFKDPDLNKYVDIGKKGGLGIFMMRRLLDKIDYRKTDAGNELWLTKNKEEKRLVKKISVSSIPLGLKARYWLISMAAFSIILILIYMFFFVNQSNVVLSKYIENAREACSLVGSDLAKNISQDELITSDLIEELIVNGSQDPSVLNYTYTTVQNLLNTEYSSILHNAFVIDNIQNILASAEIDSFYTILDTFEIPRDHKELEPNVFSYQLKSGIEVIDVNWPVKDSQGRTLCTIHFLIDSKIINEEIAHVRLDYFNLALLVWIIGSAGLFLLIYLVMAPFKRLQEWVKALGQPGAAEELDIDTSTEVGEIAKAFSDITLKLRDSQANLAEQERLQKEMQVAQEIQQTLLPSEFPKLEGYDLSSFYAAAKEVGGDYFDFVEVDQDTLGIVVADVSGKGVPGSLVMTMIRTALRTEARGIKDAAQVLTRVNDFVVNDMKKGMFVTLFYVIIDSKRRRINFASAGHNPMILYRESQRKTYYLNPRGFPIGISLPDKDLFKNSLESDTIALAKGDILVVYTDGVTEAMNTKRELFGEERFLKVIQENGLSTAEGFVENLKAEILSFTEGFPQNDDITLVSIKEETTAEMLELDRAKQTFMDIQQGESVKRACKKFGISTYSYYNKYKERFETEGIDNIVFEEPEHEFEVKQLSIEEKTKIFDIIRKNPELGAKRISEELNTQDYEFTQITPAKIYDELVNLRLNTKKLRENFMARSTRKKRIKPPGTPMMTIDGKIIIDKPKFWAEQVPEPPKPIVEAQPPEQTEKQPGPEEKATTDVVELVQDEALETGPETDAAVQETNKEKVMSFEDIADYNIQDNNWLTDTDLDLDEDAGPLVESEKPENQEFADDAEILDDTDEIDLDEIDGGLDVFNEFIEQEVFLDGSAADAEVSESEIQDLVDGEQEEPDAAIDQLYHETDLEGPEYTGPEQAEETGPEIQDLADADQEEADAETDQLYHATDLEGPEYTGPKQAEETGPEIQDLADADQEEPDAEIDQLYHATDLEGPEYTVPEQAEVSESEIQDLADVEQEEPDAEVDQLYHETGAEGSDQAEIDQIPDVVQEDLMEIKVNETDDFDEEELDSIDIGDLYDIDTPVDDSETSDKETSIVEPFQGPVDEDQKITEQTDAVVDEQEFEITTVDDSLLLDSLDHDFSFDDEQMSPADMVIESGDEDLGPPPQYDTDALEKTTQVPENDDSEIMDIGVEGKHKISEVEQEERELLDMLESRKSYIDIPEEKDVLHFDDSDIEDVNVISESDPVQPFEEFIEKEADKLEYPEEGPEIVEKDFDFSTTLDDIWDIKEMKPESSAASRPSMTQEEPDKLSFEDLINLAGGNEPQGPKADTPEIHKEYQPLDVQGEKDKLFRDKLLDRAIRLYENEEYIEAIRVLQELKANYSQDLKVHGYLGNAYFHSKQYHLAAQEYEKVLQINAYNIQACENLGVVYANQGNLSKAIEQWEKLLQITPERRDIQKSIERAKKYLNKTT